MVLQGKVGERGDGPVVIPVNHLVKFHLRNQGTPLSPGFGHQSYSFDYAVKIPCIEFVIGTVHLSGGIRPDADPQTVKTGPDQSFNHGTIQERAIGKEPAEHSGPFHRGDDVDDTGVHEWFPGPLDDDGVRPHPGQLLYRPLNKIDRNIRHSRIRLPEPIHQGRVVQTPDTAKVATTGDIEVHPERSSLGLFSIKQAGQQPGATAKTFAERFLVLDHNSGL